MKIGDCERLFRVAELIFYLLATWLFKNATAVLQQP
jgi:hypothetical protein